MRYLKTLETTGQLIEVIGLTAVLLTAIWQVSVTDWFDSFPARSQHFIQETANLAVLRTLDKMALALTEKDTDRREKLLFEASDLTRHAVSDLIGARLSVEKVSDTQGIWLKLIRHALFVIGAALVIVGKVLILAHKARTAQSHLPPEVNTLA